MKIENPTGFLERVMHMQLFNANFKLQSTYYILTGKETLPTYKHVS